MQRRHLAWLALLTGCDALFGLSTVTLPVPIDAGQDATSDAAPCERIGYPGLPLSDTEIAPYVLAVGDVNGDGKLDAATPNLSSNTVSLFLGVGDGTFMQQRTFPTDLSPRAVAIADS